MFSDYILAPPSRAGAPEKTPRQGFPRLRCKPSRSSLSAWDLLLDLTKLLLGPSSLTAVRTREAVGQKPRGWDLAPARRQAPSHGSA